MGLKNINAVISPHTPAPATPSAGLRAEPFRLSAEAAPPVLGKKWDIDRSHADFVELQKINDRLNSTAKIQRTFEKRFEKLNDYIERMKAQLEGILKQFPPYPPGERGPHSGPSFLCLFPKNGRPVDPSPAG